MFETIRTYIKKSGLLLIMIAALLACTNDNPDPTGLFTAEFTGDFAESLEGDARFSLRPSGANGVVIIELKESEDIFIRLTLPNASPNQIFIEPGKYTIVPQFGNNLATEVLVDFIDGNLSFTASNGEVNVGISKPDQLSGSLVNAEFQLLRSMCNGTFDSTPQ